MKLIEEIYMSVLLNVYKWFLKFETNQRGQIKFCSNSFRYFFSSFFLANLKYLLCQVKFISQSQLPLIPGIKRHNILLHHITRVMNEHVSFGIAYIQCHHLLRSELNISTFSSAPKYKKQIVQIYLTQSKKHAILPHNSIYLTNKIFTII